MSASANKIAWSLAGLLAVLYCAIESKGFGDLYIFLSAASDLSSQQDIFANKYVDGYHYYYSVLFAVLIKPLCYLPFRLVKFLWLLFNTALFFHLAAMLINSNLVKRLGEKQRLVFLVCTFLFSLRFFTGNIGHSQITILILWCCVYGLYSVMQGQWLHGSLVLAIGINIKLLPIVLLPYLLYRGFFKAFFLTIVFYAISLWLPALIIGHQYNSMLLGTWLSLINPANQMHVLDVEERSFHGLSTLLSTLLVEQVPDVYALPIKRNIADVSLAALAKILLAVRLLLVALTLYFLKGRPFKQAPSQHVLLTEVSYILLLIPLIFPHQQYYAFLFMIPAFVWALYNLIVYYHSLSKAVRLLSVAVLASIYLCADLALILGVFNRYYEHFKILTYGALLLIPALITVSLKNQKMAGTPARSE